MSDLKRMRALLRAIRRVFPPWPEAQLCYAVIEQAVKDACSYSPGHRLYDGAVYYLAGDLPHAALCGVDPDYVRRLLRESGLIRLPEVA